jgi:hypothetical protein
LIVFSIPLSAIIGSFYLKSQKLKLQNKSGLANEDLLLLKRSLESNQNVQERLQNLETIITSLDKEILALKTQDDALRVKEIASEIKKDTPNK